MAGTPAANRIRYNAVEEVRETLIQKSRPKWDLKLPFLMLSYLLAARRQISHVSLQLYACPYACVHSLLTGRSISRCYLSSTDTWCWAEYALEIRTSLIAQR